MARSIWSGTIEFGLVSIPISLSAATESKSIAFHQLHKKCGTRIREQRFCPHCDELVDWADIEKGYEYQKNKYVVVTQDDLDNLPLPSKKVIVLQSFVDQAEIDPVYFNGSYYAEPDKTAERPFALLLAALKKNNLTAVGTLALRNKERLCCIRVMGKALVVEILLYPDEIRKAPEVEAPQKVSDKELAVANHLIKLMSGKFAPEEYHDHYREALQQVIQNKMEGGESVSDAEPAKKGHVVDLMEALQASIASASKGGGRKRSPSSSTTGTPPDQTRQRKSSAVSKGRVKSKSTATTKRNSTTTTSGKGSRSGKADVRRKHRRGAA